MAGGATPNWNKLRTPPSIWTTWTLVINSIRRVGSAFMESMNSPLTGFSEGRNSPLSGFHGQPLADSGPAYVEHALGESRNLGLRGPGILRREVG